MYLIDTDVDDNISVAPYSTHHGAGIAVGGGGSVNFRNGSISGNIVNRAGGAVHVKDAGSSFIAEECSMTGNRSGGDSSGGAMFLTGGTVSLTNCMITGNITGTNYWSSGGGIYNAGATLNIEHSTIAGNWAKKRGGGIYTGAGTTTCDGCLLWNNEALDANTDDVKGETGTTSITYSAIKSGSGYTGSNNISSISGSVFVSSIPATNGNPTKGGDYHIVPDALEAIDSANPASLVICDIDSQIRTDSVNDMGADELGSICTGEQPSLTLSLQNTQWASYADYLARNLSVEYRISNGGSSAAYNLEVVGSTATNGAYGVTSMPLNLGNVDAGSSAAFTLKYSTPAGVGNFLSTVYATAYDGCNTIYHYPSPYSG
jgi:hypothetical protein